jgi:hypothetical protein
MVEACYVHTIESLQLGNAIWTANVLRILMRLLASYRCLINVVVTDNNISLLWAGTMSCAILSEFL